MVHRFAFDTIDSTNDEAKRIFRRERKTPVAVVSKCQTRGRGRNNRSWNSPSGKGLYLTYGNISEDTDNIAFRLMLLSSLAVKDTVRSFVSAGDIRIKWPNDILIDEKKVCGILNEGILLRDRIFYITGIGLNIHEDTKYKENSIYNSNYLCRYCDKDINIDKLSEFLIINLEKYDNKIKDSKELGEMMKIYRRSLYMPNKEVKVARIHNNDTLVGIIKGIDESGNLQVLSNNSIISLNSAEIIQKEFLF